MTLHNRIAQELRNASDKRLEDLAGKEADSKARIALFRGQPYDHKALYAEALSLLKRQREQLRHPTFQF
ncbi:MAG: hypothetical protein KGJ13_03950 [Patescibacteria group bacterium]|nr:hypothetical protein [Patescibacteria group bacterium]